MKALVTGNNSTIALLDNSVKNFIFSSCISANKMVKGTKLNIYYT